MSPAQRLPASERRAPVLECACKVFSQGSYRGTTTAELARSAGVTEPILYRHFDSKSSLFAEAFRRAAEGYHRLRNGIEAAIAPPDATRGR